VCVCARTAVTPVVACERNNNNNNNGYVRVAEAGWDVFGCGEAVYIGWGLFGARAAG